MKTFSSPFVIDSPVISFINPPEPPVHAPILYLPGVDHQKLRSRCDRGTFLLTDLHASVIKEVVA